MGAESLSWKGMGGGGAVLKRVKMRRERFQAVVEEYQSLHTA